MVSGLDPDPGTTSRGTRTSSQSPRIPERGPRTLLSIPGPRVAVRGLRLRVRVSRNSVSGLCFRSGPRVAVHGLRLRVHVLRNRSPDLASDPGTTSRGTRTSSQSPRIAERGLRILLPIRDHESRYTYFVSESTYRGTRSLDFASDPGTTSRGIRTSSQSPRIAERGLRTLLPIRDPVAVHVLRPESSIAEPEIGALRFFGGLPGVEPPLLRCHAFLEGKGGTVYSRRANLQLL